ncbi:MAG TPA: transposase [Phenylobacterium sp.]|jgi:transposase|nr:transposase [Phenylobacterium sp.]
MAELFDDLPEQASGKERSLGRARLREPVRDEVSLRAYDLDSLIEEDHPARVIWAYAVQVDMSAFEAAVRAREGTAGMPQTSPHLLLALWLYATTDGIGSARALARACEGVAAYRWLCGDVGVNHRILSEFRNDQGARIEQLLCDHVASLSAAGLIDLDEVAQDGVRIRASAGAASFRRRKTLRSELVKAKALLRRLSRQDDDDPPSARKLRAARERAERVKAALANLAEVERLRAKREKINANQTRRQKEPRASTTDPQARIMKMADGGFRPAYNVQFASLPGSGIILDVTCQSVGSDRGLAEPMARRLEQAYGRRPKRHLVDGGYQSADDIAAAEAAGTDFYCPPGKTKSGRDPYEPRQKDTPPVARWRARMATEPAKDAYKRRSVCELVHAKLRNQRIDRLHLRGRAKVETWMRWFALGSNILTAHRLAQA